MNNRTVLQIPMSTELRDSATAAAIEEGFSSLQEAVRVIISKLAKKEMGVTVTPTVKLSKRAIERYKKMDEDFELGRNVYSYGSAEDFLEKLKFDANTYTQTVREKPQKKNKAK